MSGLLRGQGPKPKKQATKPQWSADKAAQRVLTARSQRQAARVAADTEINALARDYWRLRIVAIDPGDAHCGVAIFNEGRCLTALECSPDEMLDMVHEVVTSGRVDVLVVEQWRLYPDKAAEQAGSLMLTSQAIGAIRWIVRHHNELICGFAAANDGATISEQINEVELVMQDASVKVPTVAVVRHHEIRPVSRKTAGDHERDAEVHGLHFILRGQGLIRGSENNRAAD